MPDSRRKDCSGEGGAYRTGEDETVGERNIIAQPT